MTLPRRHKLPVRTRAEFMRHAAGYFVFGMAFLALSLGIGIVGYHWVAGLDWIDSLLNASMILTGMGPVDPMRSESAKLFASFYAIVSGAAYPAVTAIVLFPFLHRMLSLLHLQSLGEGEDES